MTRDDIVKMAHEANIGTYINLESYLVGNHLERFAELVAAAEREWVGLTDEDIEDCLEMSIQGTCRAIEAKLKDKNT